jgi:hypothetical protein
MRYIIFVFVFISILGCTNPTGSEEGYVDPRSQEFEAVLTSSDVYEGQSIEILSNHPFLVIQYQAVIEIDGNVITAKNDITDTSYDSYIVLLSGFDLESEVRLDFTIWDESQTFD